MGLAQDRIHWVLVFLVSAAGPLFSQSASLVLSSGSTTPGAPASLNLALSSAPGTQSAAVQWTITYSAAEVVSLSVAAGPALTAAGKSLSCASGTGYQTCIGSGMNTTAIADGVVAVVTVTLAPSVAASNFGVINAVAATPDGAAVPITSTGGTLVQQALLTLASLTCTPSAIPTPGSASCSAALSGTAAASTVVALASSNGNLTVPATVTVAAGAASTSWTASAAAVASDQSATITATLNGSSKTASLNLTAPLPTVTVLSCSPSTVLAGASANCTLGLSNTVSAATTVSLASSNILLSLPSGVSVASGSASATFAATAGSASTDQSATITATLNGSSKTASLTITAPPPTIASLVCNPTALSSGTAALCTVVLNKTAGAGGAAVSLASDNPAASVPASVNVAAGATSASFGLSAGTVTADGTVNVAATLNGTQKTASLSLMADPALASLSCTPPGLASGDSATCVLTLSKPATGGGATIAISAGSPLTAPASAVIPAGASSTNFSVSAGTITAEGTATLTASFNGVQKTASFALLVSLPALSALSCARSTLAPGGTTTCTVTLSKAAGDTTVTLSTSSSGVTAPASVVVPSGSTTGSFSIQAASAFTGWVMLSAQLGTMKKSAVIAVRASATVNSVSCNSSKLIGSSSADCEIKLAETAPAGGAKVRLSASTVRLRVPPEVEVAEGTRLARFTVRGSVSDRSEDAVLSAAHSGDDLEVTQVALVGIEPLALACSPRAVEAGDVFSCELRLNSAEIPDSLNVAISSSSEALLLPPTVITRPWQSTVSFRGTVGLPAGEESAVIEARFGDHVVQAAVLVAGNHAPTLQLPGPQVAAAGRRLAFAVSAAGGDGHPVLLSGWGLPEGASFDPESGRFEWVPAADSEGFYTLRFTATAGTASAHGEVLVEVDSGKPVITALRNAASGSSDWACSPGSVAALTGKWLASSAAEDRSGTALELAGTRVSVNDERVPVLRTAAGRVEFLCPDLAAGSPLTVALDNEFGTAAPVRTTMRHAAPGLYAVDSFESAQGARIFSGGSMPERGSFRASGQAAQPADSLIIQATGLSPLDSPLLVLLGDVPVMPDQVTPVAAGTYAVRVQVPEGAPFGDAIPLALQVSDAGGAALTSNTVMIAIEPRRP